MTETPANTPKPIGSTSSFFPGGSKAVCASGLAVGDTDDDDDDAESGNGNDEDGGNATVDGSGLSGCGSVAVGRGTEDAPITTTGPPEDGTPTLLLPVSLGGNETELLKMGNGTEVSVIETTGGGTDPEPAGGELVMVEAGKTVLEETPVLERSVAPEETTLGVDEGVPLVLVNVGGEVKVDDGNCVDTVELDPGGRAPGALLLPLSGVSVHDFSCITASTPFTTVGVRVIVHV